MTWPFVGQSPFGLLFLDVAAFGRNVVVAGVLQLLYSNDFGATFNESNATVGAGQCVRAVGPAGAEVGFAAVGDWGLFTEVNGIVLSLDGGATFTTVSDNMTADSRYGAFPTATTFFVTGGSWPGEFSTLFAEGDLPWLVSPFDSRPGPIITPSSDTHLCHPHIPRVGEGADDDPIDDSSVRGRPHPSAADPSTYTHPIPADSVVSRRFSKYHVLRSGGEGRGSTSPRSHIAWVDQKAAGRRTGRRSLQTDGWTGQIARTLDGGKTWATVYTEAATSEFYFNVRERGYGALSNGRATVLLLTVTGWTT